MACKAKSNAATQQDSIINKQKRQEDAVKAYNDEQTQAKEDGRRPLGLRAIAAKYDVGY
jgi:hypothetical protein